MGSIQKAVNKLSTPFRLALGSQFCPIAPYLIEQVIEFEKLRYLSGRSPEEVKIHLRSFPGSIRSLRAFYIQHNAFPCELSEKKAAMLDNNSMEPTPKQGDGD